MTLMFRSRFFARALAIGAAIAVLLPAAAASGDSDGDGISDGVEAETARNLLTHSTSDSFFIRSRSVGASLDDVFEVDYDSGKFTVLYSRVSGGATIVSYTLQFRRLVEFVDDGSGDVGGSVVNETDLTAEYAGVTATYVTTVDGEAQTVFTAATTSDVFTVTVGASERFARVDSGLVTPMEVKVDLEVRGFAYAQPGTSLALEVEIEAATVPRVENISADEARGWATGEAQVNVSTADGSVFFSWAETALADGAPRAVRATPLEWDGAGYEFYLVYGRATDVVHDPKMGAESEAFWSIWFEPEAPVPRWDLTWYVVGLVAAAGILAGTFLFRRRRSRDEGGNL